MNPAATSKENILKASRELIQRQGWSAVNIRSVAAACGVSVGAIYNYFDSKTALVTSAVESIWLEIFHRPEDAPPFQDICSCTVWMYERIGYGRRRYPGVFPLHSLAFLGEDKSDGRQRMEQARQHIQEELCAVLSRDRLVRPGAFTASFTAERFASLLFSLILSAFPQEEDDPAPLLEIIRRTLY